MKGYPSYVNTATELFLPESITRFIAYFKTLISQVLSNPQSNIANLEIITEEEKQQVLIDFNRTQSEYPSEKPLHGLFESQVERAPDRSALTGESLKTSTPAGRNSKHHLTYRCLNNQAEQVAYDLKEEGAQTESIIAIMLGRSLEMIIGILGILKAGGAYLPIDPDFPMERIRFMLRDSGAKVLITSSEVKEIIDSSWYSNQGISTILVDSINTDSSRHFNHSSSRNSTRLITSPS